MSDIIDLGQATTVSDTITAYRRLITDTDPEGCSFILSDSTCPNAQAIMGIPQFATTELWKTHEAPAGLGFGGLDPAAGSVVLSPPTAGTVFRIVEFPPDAVLAAQVPDRKVEDLMHRTPSIDYAYVIEGEIYAVLDKGETLMRAGDVMIQRGTNHTWSNRSDRSCRVLFVLVSATIPS